MEWWFVISLILVDLAECVMRVCVFVWLSLSVFVSLVGSSVNLWNAISLRGLLLL